MSVPTISSVLCLVGYLLGHAAASRPGAHGSLGKYRHHEIVLSPTAFVSRDSRRRPKVRSREEFPVESSLNSVSPIPPRHSMSGPGQPSPLGQPQHWTEIARRNRRARDGRSLVHSGAPSFVESHAVADREVRGEVRAAQDPLPGTQPPSAVSSGAAAASDPSVGIAASDPASVTSLPSSPATPDPAAAVAATNPTNIDPSAAAASADPAVANGGVNPGPAAVVADPASAAAGATANPAAVTDPLAVPVDPTTVAPGLDPFVGATTADPLSGTASVVPIAGAAAASSSPAAPLVPGADVATSAAAGAAPVDPSVSAVVPGADPASLALPTDPAASAAAASAPFVPGLAVPLCVDNDTGAAAQAVTFAVPVASCADVIALCALPDIGDLARSLCPLTCGVCSPESATVAPTDPAAAAAAAAIAATGAAGTEAANGSTVSDDGDGEGEGEALSPMEEEAEEADKNFGFPVATTLVSFLIFSMYVLYLLNNQDPQLRVASYKTISLSIAIFMSLMLEKSQHKIIHGVLPKILPGATVKSLEPVILATLGMMWYVAISRCCWACRDSRENLDAVKGVVMHSCAFVAIELSAGMQQRFAEAAGGGMMTLVMYGGFCFVPAVFLKFMSMLCENWRHGCPDDGHGPTWHHIAEECEFECSGLVFGYLISTAVTYACTGVIQTHACAEGLCDVTYNQQAMMLGYGVGALMLFYISVSMFHKASHEMHHTMENFKIHCMFIATWIWLNLIQNFILSYFRRDGAPQYQKSHAIQSAFTAFLTSPFLVISIFSIDKLGDGGYISDSTSNEILEAIGLLMGLVWEKAFHSAVTLSADSLSLGASKEMKGIQTGVLSAFVVLTLWPAWQWYVLPTAALDIPKRFEARTSIEHGSHLRASIASLEGLGHHRLSADGVPGTDGGGATSDAKRPSQRPDVIVADAGNPEKAASVAAAAAATENENVPGA